MKGVIALAEYRRRVEAEKRLEEIFKAEKPVLRDSEIWTQDYGTMSGIVFGILKVKDIIHYHAPQTQDADFLLLYLLSAAHGKASAARENISVVARELKSRLVAELSEENRRELTAGLLILDLIEKTPAYRSRANKAAGEN